MRIGIDSRAVSEPGTAQRGIGRYVRGLFDALGKHPASKLEILWSDEPAPGLDVWLASSPLQHCPIPARSGPPHAAIWYDCSPDADESVWHRGSSRWAWYCSVLAEIRDYRLVVTLSEHAKTDLVERHRFDPDRIAVIGADCDPMFRPARNEVETAEDIHLVHRLGILDRFMVFVGGQDPRKGAHRLAEAWSLIPEDLRRNTQLVYAYEASQSHGDSVLSWGFKFGLKRAQGDPRLLFDLGLQPSLVFTGAVTDRELVALYRQSLAAVYPSLYEGFGLPILEATRCGTAVIFGHNTSQPEVLGGAGVAVDAADPHAIAGAIRPILASPAARDAIARHGRAASWRNSWARTAATAIGALDAIAATHRVPAIAG